MTIRAEEDGLEVDYDEEKKKDVRASSPSKPKSEMTGSTEENLSDHKINGTDAATVETASKSKAKKKKKKLSRKDAGISPEMLSVFSDDKSSISNGVDSKTIISTTSSKMKTKGTKKKKKKTSTGDDGEAFDLVSLSSKKSSQPKKKKKKKITRESTDDSPDVTPECSAQSVTSSVKSKSSSKRSKSTKSPKSKTTKNKVKNRNDIEHTFSDMEGTSKSYDPKPFSNDVPKRTMSMDNGQESNFVIKRTMSLDTANSQFHSGQHMHGGRMNSNWGGRGRAHGGRGRGPPPTGRGRGRGRGPPPTWASRSMRPPDRMPNGEPLPTRSSSHERMRSSSHERMNYGGRPPSQERHYGPRSVSSGGSSHGARSMSYHERPSFDGRSPSQERPPYGSPRAANGRGMVPVVRGRRPMSPQKHSFDGSPNVSSHSRGHMYRAPSRPKSILRNSSHHGMLSGSSHHRSIGTSSSHSSSHARRVNIDLNAGSRHSTRSGRSYNKYDQSSYGSEIDSSDIESDGEDDSSFALEDPGRKKPPSTIDNKAYSRSLSGLGTNSSHHGGLSHFKAQNQSARSLLTIERSEYQNENRFIWFLRYIHFLPPHPNEDPIKKKIRIITWCALLCDFLNALGEQNKIKLQGLIFRVLF